MNDHVASPGKRVASGVILILFRGVSLWPWVNLVLLYSFAFAVRSGFGKWPQNEMDGVDLPVVHVGLPIVMTFYEITLTGLPLIWAATFMISVFAKQTQKIMIPAIVFMSGILATWYLGRVDPWGFQNWLLH
jgi:hypothetical protein